MRVSFGDSSIRELKDLRCTLKPNAKDLGKLKRFDCDVPPNFPLQTTSYTVPLYIYYRAICASGQTNIARSILGLLHIIQNKRIKYRIPDDMADSYVRSHLKFISSQSFTRTFSTSPAYMYFVHLHALGGKAPYSEKDIVEDVSSWVDNNKQFNYPEYVTSKIDHCFSIWNVNHDPSQFLPFSEFCNDVLRWGTSGGAKKVTFLGDEFRSKWAWGFSNLTTKDGKELSKTANLYETALRQGENAKVALKEEATKTRPVITTSMASYLRQSYLAYRWGRPPINSPIASSSWLPLFQTTNYNWYGCLDGDRFDQTIPAWVVRYIIKKLGEIDEESRVVSLAELDALDNLHVEWGHYKWKWQGGLLSGWRFTSLIGSLVSYVAAEFIIEQAGLQGSMNYGVMGDDLILYSNTSSLSPETMTSLYNKFGLKANLNKTTSGPIGEYLRKTYSELGVLGYPALALRTCIYANPWISTYQQEFEDEISTGWLTFYSRLLPLRCSDSLHRFIFNTILYNIKSQSKWPHIPWADWLRTPISAGGGGPSEWSDPSKWTIIIRDKQQDKKSEFYAAIGLVKPKKLALRDQTSKKLNFDSLLRKVEMLERTSKDFPIPKFPKNINLTKTLFNWFVNDDYSAVSIGHLLGYPIPRGLRSAGKTAILDYLLGQNKSKTGISSVQTTKDIMSAQNRVVKFITRSLSTSKILNGVRNLGAAATIYAAKINVGNDVTYGTW